MKNDLIFCLMLVVAISGCASQISEGPKSLPEITQSEKLGISGDFLSYENPDYGIKISYPSGWQQTENENVIAAFVSPKTSASDTVQESLGLTMNDLAGQGLTLQKYNEIAINQLKQTFLDITILESETASLADNPAHKVVFTASNRKFLQIWTLKNDLAYIWTFVSVEEGYAAYISTAQRMLDSFEITKNLRTSIKDDKDVDQEADAPAGVSDIDSPFLGSWRIFSERIFYDIGGAGAAAVPVTRDLELRKDGKWNFGDSQGTWSVTGITDEDWSRWGIKSYGPTRKIILEGWNKSTADGPIEEASGSIEFVWAIYHVEPPVVQNAGTLWIKFGRS